MYGDVLHGPARKWLPKHRHGRPGGEPWTAGQFGAGQSDDYRVTRPSASHHCAVRTLAGSELEPERDMRCWAVLPAVVLLMMSQTVRAGGPTAVPPPPERAVVKWSVADDGVAYTLS